MRNKEPCILKGFCDVDESGIKQPFETKFKGIPEACSRWASGYKHAYMEAVSLFYEDGKEVPNVVTDYYYDRYYYGRYIFDDQGQEYAEEYV